MVSVPRAEPAPDVLLVVNPGGSQWSDEVRAAIESAIQALGTRYRWFEIPAENPRDAVSRAVRRAVSEGCRRIVATGGDGTVSMTAASLPRTGDGDRPALAIVPTGTANVLARELGVPSSITDAVALAIEGDRTLGLDTIVAASGWPVLTQVGIGPDARMIRDTPPEQRAKLGRWAYVIEFVRRSMRRRPERYDLDIDGVPLRVRAWQLVLANAGAAGTPPFTWGPGIDPTDGVVDLCVYDARTLADYLRITWRVMTGRHRRDSSTRYFRVRERVTIRSRRPVLVQGDGEILGRTPITLAVEPRALRVLVPREMGGIEGVVGTPDAPAATVPPAEPAPPGAQDGESVGHDVETMMAQHSRTWVLQGALGHPLAALAALDAALFLRVNAITLPRSVDRALVTLSRLMHYGEGWAAVALAFLVADFGRGLRVTAEALPVLWLTMLTVNYPLKRLFRRRRPFAAFVNARVSGPRPRDFSLPSGHSAAAFAGALLFGSYAPEWAPAFYALATVIAFSRVYLGVHYPSDVVLGAAAGTALAAIALSIVHALVPRL